MKKIIFALNIGLAFATVSFVNADVPTGGDATTRVEIPVRALLTPEYGFEEKNNVQVVLWGMLPNQCYTLSESDVEKQPDGKSFIVRQYAIHDTTGVCADENSMPDHMKMIVPYTTEVSIGHLVAGKYEFIFDLPNGQTQSRLMVVQKNLSPTIDTLPYAAVSTAAAPDVINRKDSVKVKISGLLNSTCTTLNPNVRVMNENDVFVLLPTVEVKTGVLCAQIMLPFEKEVDLGQTFPGVHLIHVRSMNGKSVSKVVVVSK